MRTTEPPPLLSRRAEDEDPPLSFHAKSGILWHPAEVENHYEYPKNSFCLFRKSFELRTIPKSAEAFLFADSRYKFWVNGEYVSRGPARSDPRWPYVDRVPIEKFLRPGKNGLAILAVHHGYATGQTIPRRPALVAEIRLGPGESNILPSDETWKCRLSEAWDKDAPRINGPQASMEIFDSRKWDPTWLRPEYDDSAWIPARKKGLKLSPFWNPTERPFAYLNEELVSTSRLVLSGAVASGDPTLPLHKQIFQENKTREAKEASEKFPIKIPACPAARSDLMVFDFGPILAGSIVLDIEGSRGDTVDVLYSEVLVDQALPLDGDSNRAISRFILAGGWETLEPAFDWRGFRFVELRFRNPDKPVVLRKLSIRRRSHPFPKEPLFKTDDAGLNRIWKISENAIRLCMQDGFLDSTSREQQQWMGDARFQALFARALTADTRLHRAALAAFARSQDAEGMTTSRYPDAHHNYPPIPSFCLHWISSFGEYFQTTGDEGPLRRFFPNILLAIRFFSRFENKDGLLENVPYWSFIDWGSDPDKPMALDTDRGGVLPALNLLYLEALRAVSGYASALGESKLALSLQKKSTMLSSSIQKNLIDKKTGLFPDAVFDKSVSDIFSEPTHSLALLHLFPKGVAKAKPILEHFYLKQKSGIKSVGSSPFFSYLSVKALLKHGLRNEALEWMRSHFGPLVDAGADATWERWHLIHKTANGAHVSSASHAWGASALRLFPEIFLGFESRAPGFTHVSLAPWLGPLQSIEWMFPFQENTNLEVRLNRKEKKISGELSIPAGMTVLFQKKIFKKGMHKISRL
ncbi:MAG: family 78 glycoside hydrolase catalytic domain [Spirochaetia bacterium]|nr:family 78 glycoside hydrolase catalytic domain [Spirochaetia bacterium]